MKLCIVTGIFEPESGGPATYTPKLAHELVGLGHEVTIVTYSGKDTPNTAYSFRLIRVVRGNKLLNRIRFFFAVLPRIARADAAYFLDHFAAGFPAALAAKICRTPYAVRIGGDYLWERYLEKEVPISLKDFYAEKLHERSEYAQYVSLIGMVLRGAKKVVFNAEQMRQLYISNWHINEARTAVIENPVPRTETAGVERTRSDHEFVFWGRFVAIKNIDSLVRAFALAKLPADYTLSLIGDGPQRATIDRLIEKLGIVDRVQSVPSMPLKDVLERVKNARAFVLPSWTDISPNQVYEALALGLPTVVTKENYLGIAGQLPRTIDPSSVDDIARALEELADEQVYEKYTAAFRAIRFDRTWVDTVRAHDGLFRAIV